MLPVRPRSDAAPRPQQNRVRYDVVPSGASSDPFLEFPPEKPEEVGVKQPIFIIVPVPSEPPRYAAQGWSDDQILSRSQDITADVGLFRTLFRRVLSLPRRAVVGTFLALRHGVLGTLLALRRVVVGTFLALHHGVMGTLLALRRVVVGTLLALHHGGMGVVLALRGGAVGTFLALRHRLVGTLQTLRGVRSTLPALRRSVVRALLTLRSRAAAAHIVARRTTSEGARWAWRSWAVVIAATTSIGRSRVSRFRRLGGDVRTLARFMSMVGHDLSGVGRSLRGRIRDAQRSAIANLGVRGPLSRLRISRVQVPATNVKLAAFAGGTAACALVAWMLGVQPNLPRLNDRTARSGAPAPGVVASKPSADNSVKTIDTAGSGTGSGNQQSITPSSVSASTVVMPPAMTVTSTPAGARVTVNGIGWGETPVTIRHLPPGQKVVRVTKEGYESQQRVIRVPDDPRSAAVRVRLRARS
jgi:hypothetical protein